MFVEGCLTIYTLLCQTLKPILHFISAAKNRNFIPSLGHRSLQVKPSYFHAP